MGKAPSGRILKVRGLTWKSLRCLSKIKQTTQLSCQN